MYIARSDGSVHPSEAAIVSEFITAAATIRPPIKRFSAAKLAAYADRLYPDDDTITAAASRLFKRRWSPLILLTMRSAERIILADGVIHEAEAGLLQQIRNIIAQWEAPPAYLPDDDLDYEDDY